MLIMPSLKHSDTVSCKCYCSKAADINISQGNVVTRLSYGGIFNCRFIENFQDECAGEEFWNSVNMW